MYYRWIWVAVLLLILPALLWGQERPGEVVMVEKEIVIKVEPELPTVMAAISREAPVIRTGELRRPDEQAVLEGVKAVKPGLSEVEVSRVENPQKILAKDRQP